MTSWMQMSTLIMRKWVHVTACLMACLLARPVYVFTWMSHFFLTHVGEVQERAWSIEYLYKAMFYLWFVCTLATVTKFLDREEGGGNWRTFKHFNNKRNKHKIKAAAPPGRLPHTKHKLKSRPGSLSSSIVVTPHLTLPKLLRGTWDRWVAQVLFIIIYSTGLAPFPQLSAPPHSSHTPIAPRRPGGTPETALYSPPPPLPLSPGGAHQGGRGVPGGKDRRGERKGDGRMRSYRDERGERGKKISRPGSRTHCRSVLNQLSGSYSRCHAMVLDIFGGRPDAPPPPGGRRWLLRLRAAGSESPVPCSSPNMVDGSRLRPPGKRGRLLRSLSDGSHPSSTQEHGSEPSVPPVLPLLQHHRLGQPLAVTTTSCCPISSAPRSPSAARALWQHVPPSSRVSAPM